MIVLKIILIQFQRSNPSVQLKRKREKDRMFKDFGSANIIIDGMDVKKVCIEL